MNTREPDYDFFRQFESNKINILTGPNGSGKSTHFENLSKINSILKYFESYHYYSGDGLKRSGEFLVHHYNGHGDTYADAYGNSKFEMRMDNFKQGRCSEGESIISSLLDFLATTIIVLKELSKIKEKTRNIKYFSSKTESDVADIKENLKRLSSIGIRTNEAAIDYFVKNKYTHIILIDEFDGGLGFEAHKLVNIMLERFEKELECIETEYKVILATASPYTLNTMNKSFNVYHIEKGKLNVSNYSLDDYVALLHKTPDIKQLLNNGSDFILRDKEAYLLKSKLLE